MSHVTRELKQVPHDRLYTNILNAQDGLLEADGSPTNWAINQEYLANPGAIVLRDMGTLVYSNNNKTILRKVQDVETGTVAYIPLIPPTTTVPSVEWANWVDGVGEETIRSVTTDAAGNVYVIGYSNTVAAMPPFPAKTTANGSLGVFVAKYSSAGVYQWVQWIDGTNTEIGFDISVDTSGNVYVTGYTQSPSYSFVGAVSTNTRRNATDPDTFVAKYNSSGALQWGVFLQGTNDDQGISVLADSNGNVYVSGFSASNDFSVPLVGGGNFTKQANNSAGQFILKLRVTDGQALWGKWIDGSDNEYARFKMALDSQKNVYLSGQTFTQGLTISTLAGTVTKPSDDAGAYIVKVNPSGDFVWAAFIDGSDYEDGFGVTIDPKDVVYFSGVTYSDEYSITTARGTIQKPGNAPGYGAGVFVKFSKTGQILDARFLNSFISDVAAYGITVDKDSNLYVSGVYFNDPNTPIPFEITTNTGVYRNTQATNNDLVGFVIKYNSYLVPEWAKFIESGTGTSDPSGQGANVFQVQADAQGNLIIGGRTQIVDYAFVKDDGTSIGRTLSGNSSRAAFVVKYKQTREVTTLTKFAVLN
jgi:hypothetical protein